MKNQRVNIFDLIHKALRAMLYDTALTIQQTDFEMEQEADTAFRKIQQVLDAFNSHAHHEDKFIIPAVQLYDASIAATIESEHGRDEILSHEMESKMEAFRFAASNEIRQEIATEIHYLFIEFTAFNLSHMNKEEHYLNEVLWKYYTDEELMTLNLEIVKSIPQEEMMMSVTWMMKGISTLQLIRLLVMQKQKMPSEAYENLFNIAARVVAPERWEKAKAALEEQLVSQ